MTFSIASNEEDFNLNGIAELISELKVGPEGLR